MNKKSRRILKLRGQFNKWNFGQFKSRNKNKMRRMTRFIRLLDRQEPKSYSRRHSNRLGSNNFQAQNPRFKYNKIPSLNKVLKMWTKSTVTTRIIKYLHRFHTMQVSGRLLIFIGLVVQLTTANQSQTSQELIRASKTYLISTRKSNPNLRIIMIPWFLRIMRLWRSRRRVFGPRTQSNEKVKISFHQNFLSSLIMTLSTQSSKRSILEKIQ